MVKNEVTCLKSKSKKKSNTDSKIMKKKKYRLKGNKFLKEPWKRQEKVTKKIRFSIFFSWERVLIEKINKGKKKYFRQFIKKPSKKILGRFIFDKSCYKTQIITQPTGLSAAESGKQTRIVWGIKRVLLVCDRSKIEMIMNKCWKSTSIFDQFLRGKNWEESVLFFKYKSFFEKITMPGKVWDASAHCRWQHKYQ